MNYSKKNLLFKLKKQTNSLNSKKCLLEDFSLYVKQTIQIENKGYKIPYKKMKNYIFKIFWINIFSTISQLTLQPDISKHLIKIW